MGVERMVSVPLATLVSATKPPSGSTKNAILSPEGRKRYFVVHGGLFSKDGVTLEDIRNSPSIHFCNSHCRLFPGV